MKANIRRIGLLTTLLTTMAILAGCALPQSASRVSVNGGSFYLPKDSKFDWLKYSQPVVLTNGQVGEISLVISNGVFKMDPAVIDKATAHDVGLLNAGGALAIQAMGLATPK